MQKLVKDLLLIIMTFFIAVGFITFAKTVKAGTIQEFTTPTSFYNSNWRQWIALENKIQYSKADMIILRWQGNGGRVDLGDKFIRFLQTTSKYVIIKIVGPSYSMHALVFCAAPHTEFKKGFLMFHLAAYEEDGRDIVDTSYESQQNNRSHMRGCVSKGLVTTNDINRINQGKVLYIYSNHSKIFTYDERM